MKKSLIAILMTAVILLSLAAPLIAVPNVKAVTSDYMTVSGVLSSDYYSLYPYETDASLKVGFSKYGELINQEDNVGLEYAEVDPYAFPVGSSVSATVPKRMWVQGWLINITYTHRTLGLRNVWAAAISADSVVYGNDWVRVDFTNDKSTTYGVEDPRDPGYSIYSGTYGSTLTYGGRKTNGTAVTAPIEVLYNGPREFIAVCRTTIYDHLVYGSNSTESDVALVQIAITIRFDKVKKDVVLLKDVKSLLVEKEGLHMNVQFSNRGEVDLGTEAVGISSYGHFWTQGVGRNDALVEGQPTVYDSSYEIFQTTDLGLDSAAGGYPQSSAATYDVAQAINPNAGYVWSAAFWPSLSDWSIDGWDSWWHSLTEVDPHYIDGVEEAFIPFYIGEWDFILYHTLDNDGRTQFRGVTQYSVGDWHDGDDANMGSINYLDSEVQYYLNETFNPWDLEAAVEKYTRRWLEWYNVSSSSPYTYTTLKAPVAFVSDAEWNDYCVFSERILDYTATSGKLLVRGVNYTASYSSVTGKVTFTFNSALKNHRLKILYSTEDDWSYAGVTTLEPYTFSANVSLGTEVTFSYDDTYTFAADPLGVVKAYGIDLRMAYTVPSFVKNYSIGDPDLDDSKYDFTVDFESGFDQTYYYWNNITYSTGSVTATVLGDGGLMDVSLDSPVRDVWVDYMDIRLHLNAFINYSASDGPSEGVGELNITLTPAMSFVLDESRMGRYEWATVGRDSETVDSAGSALVAEAFDSLKEVQIGIAGADMVSLTTENSMPNVMAKFGSGTAVADYKDTLLRAALKDDWCTYWPVASSNMIGTGGPLANLLAYYANDFTDAFYGLTAFSGTAYSGKIAGITCWDRNWQGLTGYNTYSSNSSIGYAVITTYKDINGTVIFEVYGDWGRDTYYATMWLHGDEARGLSPGIVQLQSAPAGVTSIILKISYTDPSHPTYTIPEVLGTISERLWIHQATDVTDPNKGGIHDP